MWGEDQTDLDPRRHEVHHHEVPHATSIDEANAHLAPLQVGFGVKSGLDAIFYDARDAFVKLGHNLAYIGVSVDVCNAFNRTSQAKILRHTAVHSFSLIRFANSFYAKGQPFLRFRDDYLCRKKGLSNS